MSDQDKIICTCANLSERKIDDYFKTKNYNVDSFNEFLNDTKAGTHCTACRLDLESIFITFPFLGVNLCFKKSGNLTFPTKHNP